MKRVKILLLIIFFILCTPKVVLASETEPTCSDIRNKYNEYNSVIQEYNNLVCNEPADISTQEQCNTLIYKRDSLIQEIYRYNDLNESCDISEVNTLLEENESRCSNSFSSELKDIASQVMNSFYIIAPFLLIIFGSIDFFKMIVNADPKSIQKNRSNFFKRIIAFILLYFTPFIVKQILSLSVYDLTGDRYVCDTEVVAPVATATRETRTKVLYSGYYNFDNSVQYDSDAAGKILKAADQVSKSWASNDFYYFDDSHYLISYDIKSSINNPSKGTCCATLVAAALYKSGLFSESEINSIPYNGAYYIAELLDNKNWQIIDSYDKLKPGDIVFMTSSGNAPVTLRNGRTYDQGHVQIYAGGNKWYNAGSTESIKGTQPSIQGESYAKGRFSFALRAVSSRDRNRSTTTSAAQNSSQVNTTSTDTSTSTTPSTSTNTESSTNTKQSNPGSKGTNTSSSTSSSSKDTNTKGTTSGNSSSSTTKTPTPKKATK